MCSSIRVANRNAHYSNVHFNENKPHLNNIYISNLRDNKAYIHDGSSFVVEDKNTVIEELIDFHIENIINLINEDNEDNLVDNIDEKTLSKLENMLEKIDNEEEFVDSTNNSKKKYPNYKAYKTDKIKNMIYNLSKKLKLNKKKS